MNFTVAMVLLVYFAACYVCVSVLEVISLT